MLSIAFVQLLLLAAALSRTLRNRSANRTMAALLLVLAGIITPWMIGFAGFYDKWRWLTFAPFQITLALPPLFWLYVHTLVHGRWPERGWQHLTPAMLQLAFYTGSFLLPMPLKERWADFISFPFSVLVSLGLIAGLLFYGQKSLQLLSSYRAALATARSDDDKVEWLSRNRTTLTLVE